MHVNYIDTVLYCAPFQKFIAIAIYTQFCPYSENVVFAVKEIKNGRRDINLGLDGFPVRGHFDFFLPEDILDQNSKDFKMSILQVVTKYKGFIYIFLNMFLRIQIFY